MSELLNNPDAELLLWSTVVNDDEKAFEKLFGLFYSPLIFHAKKYIVEQAIREDIVQDVFVALWEGRKRLKITNSVRNYLMLSVRNNCLNHLRKEGLTYKYQEFILASKVDGSDDVYLLSELYDLLEKALDKLPASYRIVFELYRMEEKNYSEIANKLNISVRTAKRYKRYVSEFLKEELKDYLPLILLFYPHIFK